MDVVRLASRYPVLLILDDSVPDVADFVLSVTCWRGPKMLGGVWKSGRGGRR